MGEKANRRFAFDVNVIKTESALSNSGCERLSESNCIWTDHLQNFYEPNEYRKFSKKQVVEFLEDRFPCAIFECDKKAEYVITSVSKHIPKNMKKKLLYIPKNALFFTFFGIGKTGYDYDQYVQTVVALDKDDSPIFLNYDNRFSKQKTRNNEELKFTLFCYVDTYFRALNAFLDSKYIIGYAFNGVNIFYPMVEEDVKDLLKNRQTNGTRRTPLVYRVNKFELGEGKIIRGHLRGISDFELNGRNMTLIAGSMLFFDLEKTIEDIRSIKQERSVNH